MMKMAIYQLKKKPCDIKHISLSLHIFHQSIYCHAVGSFKQCSALRIQRVEDMKALLEALHCLGW